MARLPSQVRAQLESERMYGEIAWDYDRHLLKDCDYRSPACVAGVLARWLPRLGGAGAESVARGGCWLDVGAGTGLLGAACQRQGLELEWVGLDLNQPMLQGLVGRTYRSRIRADALGRLPFRAQCFSGAAAVGLMEHVVDPHNLLENISRVLQDDALFVFTYCPSPTGQHCPLETEPLFVSHGPEQVTAALAQARLRVLEACDEPGYLNGPEGWVTHRVVVSQRMA